MGEVVLVGAGPGDEGLVTIKGKQYIEQADCIIYDRLIGKEILTWAKEGCELIYVGKAAHRHTMSQDKINELLLEKSCEHNLVVRLKGGDPYVFGRGGEEALFLIDHRVKVAVVPGVSSALAGLSSAGIPITHRGIARSFRVITAHSKKDSQTEIDYQNLTDEEETLVFLMGLGHLGEIAKRLIDAGREKNTPAAVISNATLKNQKTCLGCLSDIYEKATAAGMESPAIIVVGDVVTLSDRLSFFQRQPLFGRKYFIPTIIGGRFSFTDGWKEVHDHRLEDRIKEMGGQTRVLEVGRIMPKRADLGILSHLGNKDYLVFTSQSAVHAFLWNLKEDGKDLRTISSCQIAVVGHKTARAWNEYGIVPDVIASMGTASSLADQLSEGLTADTRIIWFKAEEANMVLQEKLSGKCMFQAITVYVNEEIANAPSSRVDDLSLEGTMSFLESFDGILFTCASNVRRTLHKFPEHFSGQIYSIGPSCSKEILKGGYEYLEAKESSYEGLIDLLKMR